MEKTASLHIRVKPSVKKQAEELFSDYGLTVSDAVNMFLHQALLEYRIPFQPHQPRYNAETLAAIQETKDIIAGRVQTKTYSSYEEFEAEIMAEIAAEDAEEARLLEERTRAKAA
ncbi:MAG: type II toxin-antitoxin system RelB/DinJ family antitoxin [Oscillospiraceae bacterium]|nr:type II toxin-antitoxin system RelB/DinJ family antitoxin [Oscillospiraceae bacterium]